MKLRVEYTAQLRTISGRPADEIELPAGSNVGELLQHLARRLGDGATPHLLTSEGSAPRSLLIVVNDQATPAHEAADRPLQPGDTVLLMPPIAGG
jgi:molybdopterin synthase sulfur carrier subunit